MGCCGRSRKAPQFRSEQKWEYINLNDFKSKGCVTHFAYAYLWFSLLMSTAVYAVDTFTAVNLLAFSNWTSKIKPDIDLNISKWVFSICIILSFINICFEHIRAWRVMARGNIAECYLDSLAVRLESTRIFGKKQGYRRFLVFAELTKSKKGTEYIALFTYFNLKSWVRVLICSGPRQVINAFTIKALYVADLNPNSASVEGSLLGFFENLKTLATEDYQKAIVLVGMCFTLIVWIFSFLFLILALFAYVFFLWHWIPRTDGGLGGYCERKVNKTLMRIVTKKVNKALRDQEEKRMKENRKQNGPIQHIDRKATLPTIPDVSSSKMSDGLAQMPTLPDFDAKPTILNIGIERKDTMQTVATLPAYSSKNSDIELNRMGRPNPSRSQTNVTNTTGYSDGAPLLNNAQDMGTISPIDKRGRSDTGLSGYSIGEGMSRPIPSTASYSMNRQNTGASNYSRNQTQSSSPYGNKPPRRPMIPAAQMNYNRSQSPVPSMSSSQYPSMRQNTYQNGPIPNRQPTLPQLGEMNMARTQLPAPFGQQNMPSRQPTLPYLGNMERSASPATFGGPTRQPTFPNILPESTMPELDASDIFSNTSMANMDRSVSPSPYGQPAALVKQFTAYNPNAPVAGVAELGSRSSPRPTRSATAQPTGSLTSSLGLARGNTSPYDVFATGDGHSSLSSSVKSNSSLPKLPELSFGASASAPAPNDSNNNNTNNGSFKPFTPQRSATTVPANSLLTPIPEPTRNNTAPIGGAGYTGSGYGSDYFNDYRGSTQSSAFDLEHYDLERQQDRRQ